MKKIQLLLGLVFVCLNYNANAQISVDINLGTPPVWAPVNREVVQYYYLPDIDTYYDVPSEKFIYIKNGHWFRSTSLPYRHKNYNLKGGNVVYLSDYRGNSPYIYHKNHKIKYFKNKDYYSDEHREDNNDHENEGRGNGKEKKHGKGHK